MSDKISKRIAEIENYDVNQCQEQELLSVLIGENARGQVYVGLGSFKGDPPGVFDLGFNHHDAEFLRRTGQRLLDAAEYIRLCEMLNGGGDE